MKCVKCGKRMVYEIGQTPNKIYCSDHCRNSTSDKSYDYGASAWLLESASVADLLVGWTFWAIMRQRNISFTDIGNHLGVSKARVGQMMKEIPENDTSRYRIDQAITEITEQRHQALHQDEDSYCAVYTACGYDDKVARAKARGEREYAKAP